MSPDAHQRSAFPGARLAWPLALREPLLEAERPVSSAGAWNRSPSLCPELSSDLPGECHPTSVGFLSLPWPRGGVLKGLQSVGSKRGARIDFCH